MRVIHNILIEMLLLSVYRLEMLKRFYETIWVLYMSETKTMIVWRCVRRNENSKAVVYTLMSTREFSY